MVELVLPARNTQPVAAKQYRYSEIFGSFQGEGRYSTVRTVWLRWIGCNFCCNGFGQADPDRPETWQLPYQDLDVSQYHSMEQLPVFSLGCDSSYSWAKKFGHLAHQATADVIAERIRAVLPGQSFVHPHSRQCAHLAITGGEPMMSQTGSIAVLNSLEQTGDMPESITFETNGTQPVRKQFADYFERFPGELFWSVSPKLSNSGEKWEQAIRPEVLAGYNSVSSSGQLKYVCDNTERTWDEIARATDLYRAAGITWPVWIMPVGSDLAGQNQIAAAVSDAALERGYNVSARIHVYVYGNVIGK